MICRSRLGEPDVAGIASQLAGLERACDPVAVADLPAGGVDDVGAALHLPDHLVVEEVLGLRVKRRVDGHHVAVRDHLRGRLVEGDAELLLDLLREPVAIGVVQADVEGLQPAQHGGADSPRGDGAHLHPLQVV